MEKYSTPKEALLAAGRIKAITRGRISRDNHAWLDDEIMSGRIIISGSHTVVKVKNEDKSIAKPAVVKTTYNGSTEKHVPDITIPYPKHLYHAVGNDGKVYGMAEVCNNCRVSLVQNQCEDPVILGSIYVRIVANGSPA